MGSLSTFTLVVFAFSPLALTIGLIAFLVRIRTRDSTATTDGSGRLLDFAVRQMPEERRDWGAAMLAELDQAHGFWARWRFALGCVRVALFPPKRTESVPHVSHATIRVGPVCGLLSVSLPPLGLPLLYFSAMAVNHFTESDDLFNGELLPGLIGVLVLLSIAFILSGVPLGIAGFLRREQVRWLSLMGSISSPCIFSYLMIVQHLASRNL